MSFFINFYTCVHLLAYKIRNFDTNDLRLKYVGNEVWDTKFPKGIYKKMMNLWQKAQKSKILYYVPFWCVYLFWDKIIWNLWRKIFNVYAFWMVLYCPTHISRNNHFSNALLLVYQSRILEWFVIVSFFIKSARKLTLHIQRK